MNDLDRIEQENSGGCARGLNPPEVLALVFEVRLLRKALADVLAVSRDRVRFVAEGPRGWLRAEQIAADALRAVGVEVPK